LSHDAKLPKTADHDDLFKARLDQIINMKHELVALADKIDWAWLDEQIAPYFPMKDALASRYGSCLACSF
jgi:hypothetical protein